MFLVRSKAMSAEAGLYNNDKESKTLIHLPSYPDLPGSRHMFQRQIKLGKNINYP